MQANAVEEVTRASLAEDIGEVTKVSWKAPANMTFEEWERVGNTLQTIQGSINWWIGDWLNEGEQRWGEMYAQAIETTGWDYSRLSQAKSVAARVQFSIRIENLTWTHHMRVADLEPDEQRYWLARAEAEHWNTRQLRDAIKHAKQLEEQVQQRVQSNGHNGEPLPGDYDDPAEYLNALYSAEGDGGDAPGAPEDSFDDWTPPPAADEDEPRDKMAVHYSSDDRRWETPQPLFDLLNEEFNFTLDVCALPENAKCQRFYSPEADGLSQEWEGVCWMNPPYGDEIKHWVRKAYQSALRGTTVVCLVPARTDTRWWWEYCIKGEIRFLKGRLRFGNAENGAPFPSAVVIFRRGGGHSRVIWWEEGSNVQLR